jgi:hypothetical protein
MQWPNFLPCQGEIAGSNPVVSASCVKTASSKPLAVLHPEVGGESYLQGGTSAGQQWSYAGFFIMIQYYDTM